MLRPSSLRRAAVSSALAALTLGVASAPASAATPPLRYVGVGVDGARTWNIDWRAAAPDAKELVGDLRGVSSFNWRTGGVLLRDVVAGKTVELVPSPARFESASKDLRRIVFSTTASYSAKDTNRLQDFYLLDRATGAKTLLTADRTGAAIGYENDGEVNDGLPYRALTDATVSGNGKVAQFTQYTAEAPSKPAAFTYWRTNLDTLARTDLPAVRSDYPGYFPAMDDAGRVAINPTDILVDGVKKYRTPGGSGDTPSNFEQWVVSPNGRFAAGMTLYRDKVVGIDLTNGNTLTIPIPGYADPYFTRIRHVADDGGSVILTDVVGRGASERYIVGRLQAGGSMQQLGGDIPFTDWEWMAGDYQDERVGGITPDGAFAFTGTNIAQLGSKPLPGTQPNLPTTAVASDYLFVEDVRCTKAGSLFTPPQYSKPTATLAVKSQKTDLRHAVSFKGTVSRTTNGAVTTANLVLSPGNPVTLESIGRNGGFKVEGTVTFDDGSRLTGATTVGTHAVPDNCPSV